MTMIEIAGLAGLQEYVGQHVGYSNWIEVDQARIDTFADATGDHQWIHVDPERAATESPYGTTIAHGFLTLSLIPSMHPDIYRLGGVRMGVNYGADKVRFPTPVKVGSRVRLGALLAGVDLLDESSAQVRWTFTVEVEGAEKPACIAQM